MMPLRPPGRQRRGAGERGASSRDQKRRRIGSKVLERESTERRADNAADSIGCKDGAHYCPQRVWTEVLTHEGREL